MLLQIGSLALEVWPLNLTGADRTSGADFAEKAVIGRAPVLEFMGAGAETLVLTARLFPEKLGGLDKLNELDTIRISGTAQYVMRGDGVPLGWMVVTSITERSSHLDAFGVGKVIDIDIALTRSDQPEDADYHSTISGLEP